MRPLLIGIHLVLYVALAVMCIRAAYRNVVDQPTVYWVPAGFIAGFLFSCICIIREVALNLTLD